MFSETSISSNFSKLSVFSLIFKNPGNSKYSERACNDYFFQDKKYINNQTALLKSMKIGYNKN